MRTVNRTRNPAGLGVGKRIDQNRYLRPALCTLRLIPSGCRARTALEKGLLDLPPVTLTEKGLLLLTGTLAL